MMSRMMEWIGLAGCKSLGFWNGFGSRKIKMDWGLEIRNCLGVSNLGGFGVSWISILCGG